MKPKKLPYENLITYVITLILLSITFGSGYYIGRKIKGLQLKIEIQKQRITFDSLKMAVDSTNSDVKIWKLQMKEKYKNCN